MVHFLSTLIACIRMKQDKPRGVEHQDLAELTTFTNGIINLPQKFLIQL